MPENRDHIGRYAPKPQSAAEASLPHRNLPNPEFSKAMHAKRSSSAVTPHDSRPNRQRTRRDSRNASIRDSY